MRACYVSSRETRVGKIGDHLYVSLKRKICGWKERSGKKERITIVRNNMNRAWPAIDFAAVALRAKFMRRSVTEFEAGKSVAMKGFGLSRKRVEVYKYGLRAAKWEAIEGAERMDIREASVVSESVFDVEKKSFIEELGNIDNVEAMCEELDIRINRGVVRVVGTNEASAGVLKRLRRWLPESGEPVPKEVQMIGVKDITVLAKSENVEDVVQAVRLAVSCVRLPQVITDALVEGCLREGLISEAAAVVVLCGKHGRAVTDEDHALGSCRGVVERCRGTAVERVARALVAAGDGRRARDVLESNTLL